MKIAVVGAGLAGGLLTRAIARWAAVTVFERGAQAAVRAPEPRAEPPTRGLFRSFSYGIGGTTNDWGGALVAMGPGELGAHWPAAVRDDLAAFYPAALRAMHHGPGSRLAARRPTRPDRGSPVRDFVLRPPEAFRIDAADFRDAARLHRGHTVLRLEETASGIVVESRRGGAVHRERFDLAVVCAGGLNSPLLLRRSGLGGSAAGENLTDHPIGFLAKVSGRGRSADFRRLRIFEQGQYVLKVRDPATRLWTALSLFPAGDLSLALDPFLERHRPLAGLRRLRQDAVHLLHLHDPECRRFLANKVLGRRDLGGYAHVMALVEQEATGQGRVREDAEGRIHLDWTISDGVVASAERALETLAAWLDCEIRLPPGGIRARLWSGAHHSGGCRIAAVPQDGVVDADLRVHGTRRVFVCDGSVLPSTGASNTGLTIAALALRLAAFLEAAHAAPGQASAREEAHACQDASARQDASAHQDASARAGVAAGEP